MRKALLAATAVALSLLLTLSGIRLAGAVEGTGTLVSKPVEATPEHLLDSRSALWGQAVPLAVQLSAAPPVHPVLTSLAAAKTITVKSLHNGDSIAFRLGWQDAARNDTVVALESFADAVALQFPGSGEVTDICMGRATSLVNIWYWRANLEKLQSLVAGGFGNLEDTKEADIVGKASYNNGEWSVVMLRSLGQRPGRAQFAPGATTSVAFAAWDGANQERDGKKAVSTWYTLTVEQLPGAQPMANVALYSIIGLLVAGALIGGAVWVVRRRRNVPV